jgi:hypothetical protein
MEKRDALIAEGHAAAARVVSEAEQAQREQLGALEQERVGLERQIDELRTFEREYRSKLKGYIEGQLRDLETTNALTTGSGAASAPAAAPQPAAPQPAAVTAGPAAEQFAAAPQAAPSYNGPQSSGPTAYPQPTDYPGFAGGN